MWIIQFIWTCETSRSSPAQLQRVKMQNKCKTNQLKAWTHTPLYLSEFLPEFLPLSYAFPPILFLLQSVPGLCPQLVVLQDFADFFAAFAVVSVLLLVIFLAALWKLNSRFSSLISSPPEKNKILSMINSALNNLQKMLRGWVQTTFCLSCVTWNVHYVDSTPTPMRKAKLFGAFQATANVQQFKHLLVAGRGFLNFNPASLLLLLVTPLLLFILFGGSSADRKTDLVKAGWWLI